MKKIFILIVFSFLASSFALAVDKLDEEEIKGLLSEAYMISGDHENAIKEYREILKRTPKDIKARISLADMLSWQKKYDESIREYEKALEIEPDNLEIKQKLANVYSWKGDYKRAKEVLKEIIDVNPDDLDAKISLADSFSYNKEFNKAISLYKEALEYKEDLEIKRKLADVLSWDKKYNEALQLYDEILKENEDPKIRLQKARILGWAREYDKSEEEYQKILDTSYNKDIELEMKAKLSYWHNRVKHAIKYYKELIQNEPENVEAMFDLSQVYSYQSMWEDAIDEYKRIINISPDHFRAKEGLQKVDLISNSVSLKSGYEFFEADSPDRANDIKRHTFFNKIIFPIDYNLQIEAGYNLTSRSFSDFGDVSENEGRIGFSYLESPDWWVNGFYDFIEYNKVIDTMHTFGGDFSFRVFDIGVSRLSFERERLENSSAVIRDRDYRDNFKERLDLDINKRFRLGIDYLFSDYSDGNSKNEPGFDLLYYFSFEPKRFSVKYRYFYREFDDKVNKYFSPKDFSTHALTLNWRHFLNKEEIFFGARDLYYDASYDVSVDSEDIVSHKFSGELNWDINKRLNFNIRGSLVNSSADVYEDKNIVTAIKYYF